MSFNKVISALFICCLAPFSIAHEFDSGSLHIDHPWSLALPPVTTTGAAYLSISNHGEKADELLGADTPAAERVEIHEHKHVDGLMKMQQVQMLAVAPGETLTFQPGGYHLMLFNLKQPLVAGEHFPLTLHFSEAGDADVVVNVQAEAPADGAEEPHMHH